MKPQTSRLPLVATVLPAELKIRKYASFFKVGRGDVRKDLDRARRMIADDAS